MDSNPQPTRIGRFDQVRLLTTKNVRYLSAPGPVKAEPGGIWSVAAAISEDLLLVKNNVTVRIPATDVLKIAEYSLKQITDQLGRLSRGESRKEESTTTEGLD